MKLERVLVVNRGEIAIRVARAARDYGIKAIGIHTAAEDPSLMRRYFEEVVEIPGNGVTAYLDQEELINFATSHEIDGIHPGYGFLSENADFAQLVTDRGICWIGPPADAIRQLGNKVVARRLANELPWLRSPVLELGKDGLGQARSFIEEHGLPVVFKAVDGGGGRGMRVVRNLSDLSESYAAAKAEAKRSFGSERCLLERFVERARHVELQVLADSHGGLALVGTRDCSLQRRYQKLLEEAPAPGISAETRQQMTEVASHLCHRSHYQGAGTFEFLVGPQAELVFLEVNTRLQVEHTVTEETSGLDLVIEQFKIAEGGEVPNTDLECSYGHAIEFRINADDVGNHFLPSTGVIDRLRLPNGPGVRVDAGIEEGSTVGPQFDSLLMKLIVHGRDRSHAIARARRALAELVVDGVTTNLALFSLVLDAPLFQGNFGEFIDAGWLEREVLPSLAGEQQASSDPYFTVGEQRFYASRLLDASKLATLPLGSAQVKSIQHFGEVSVAAPMQAVVTRMLVNPGDGVHAGAPLFALEAMKMENLVVSPTYGTVKNVYVRVGDNVRRGEPCVMLEAEPEELRGE